MMALIQDWGLQVGARVFADSSAALGVINRKGCGKLRHVRVNMLWVQGVREQGTIDYNKIGGPDNPGDLMTKHLSRTQIDKYLHMVGIAIQGGRADVALDVDAGLGLAGGAGGEEPAGEIVGAGGLDLLKLGERHSRADGLFES